MFFELAELPPNSITDAAVWAAIAARYDSIPLQSTIGERHDDAPTRNLPLGIAGRTGRNDPNAERRSSRDTRREGHTHVGRFVNVRSTRGWSGCRWRRGVVNMTASTSATTFVRKAARSKLDGQDHHEPMW